MSNFYSAPVVVDGLRYLSSEGAYQAAKYANREDRALFACLDQNVYRGFVRARLGEDKA